MSGISKWLLAYFAFVLYILFTKDFIYMYDRADPYKIVCESILLFLLPLSAV